MRRRTGDVDDGIERHLTHRPWERRTRPERAAAKKKVHPETAYTSQWCGTATVVATSAARHSTRPTTNGVRVPLSGAPTM